MSLSPALVGNALADNTSDPLLVLLTISHADLAVPIRLVRNTADIVSRGLTFTAFPFEFVPPGLSDGSTRAARISIDNVDNTIVQLLRALTTAPQLLIEIILASAPNTVEETLPLFKLNTASGDRFTMEAELMAQGAGEDEPLVKWTFTPSIAPALFA